MNLSKLGMILSKPGMKHQTPAYDSVIWWRQQIETFSALLTICTGNSPVPGEFPAQRPVTRSCDVFFDLRLNKRLSKQSWGWWFETQLCPLWRHRNEKPTMTCFHAGLLKQTCRHPRDHHWNNATDTIESLWHQDLETLSASLAMGLGNPPVTGGFPSQRGRHSGALICSLLLNWTS